jgi:hypothetical protein
MQRDYSRDDRPYCEPMVIALIVNREGFPLSYETSDGNRAHGSTMENDFEHGGVNTPLTQKVIFSSNA